MSDIPPPRWRRPLFLWSSAAIVVAVIVAASEVMLPFILAVVIAYVLTPLVVILERRRVPRGIAILCVYAIVLGSLGGFLTAIAPRIGGEFRSLRAELPKITAQIRDRWVPAITDRMRAVGMAPEPPPGRSPPRIEPPMAPPVAAPSSKSGFENLEDEMASLLGRPKTPS